MRGVDAQQRQFLARGRPGAALAAAVALGIADAVSPSRSLGIVLVLLGVVFLTVPPSLVAAHRFPLEHVVRGALVADVALIAGMTRALALPDILVVAYYAPAAFAALLFGPLDTLVFTALGVLATVVVGVDIGARPLTLLIDTLVLAITGVILAALSREVREASARAGAEREHDVTALRIAERIRASLDLNDVLGAAVEEIGVAARAVRCRLRLGDTAAQASPLHEWTREGAAATPPGHTPKLARRILATGEALIVEDARRADPELRAFVQELGAVAFLGVPIRWGDRNVGVLGVFDDRPREWRGVLPLLERIRPQLGAAIAQAELFEQQQHALERLEELTRLREELIANVSHELRTPLTSTIGFLRTLEREDVELDPPQRRALLEIAREEAERLARLVGDLLELARFERGTVQLQLEPVRLAELAARASDAAEVPSDREVRLELGEELVVEADRDRLFQVLCNLVSNAVRHGDGTIVVRGSDDEQSVTLEVSDSGAGLSAHDAEDLFAPFARGATMAEGTGLGLAIARRIVEAHGGRLSYRAGDNGGSHAFVLELPKEAEVAAQRAPWR